MPTSNSTYPPRPQLLFIFWSSGGLGPEEANERQGWQNIGEARQLGAALPAPEEGPAPVAIRQHEPQRQEHQHAQQQLLVGQRDKVSAFLIKIGESGDAEKSPHGLKASSVTPGQRQEILFFFSPGRVLVFRCSPQNVLPQRSAGDRLKSRKHRHEVTIQIRGIYKIIQSWYKSTWRRERSPGFKEEYLKISNSSRSDSPLSSNPSMGVGWQQFSFGF